MKTATEILATESWPKEVCRKYSPHAWQDLQQELFLLIATDAADKAAKALEAGYFEFFYIRCAANLSRPQGKVARMAEGWEDISPLQISDEPEDEERERLEFDQAEKLAAIEQAKVGMEWYESKLVELYLSGMSRRKIHIMTRIPKNEVGRVIREFKQKCFELYQ